MGITAAAVPVKFSDGTTYQFSPLTDKDMDEIDAWLQARIIETARASLKPGMSQAERDETLSLAMRESLTITFMSPTGARMLGTLPGMVRLAWQSMRRDHPNITETELREQLMKPENLDAINEAFQKVNSAYGVVAPKNGRRVKRKNVHR